MIYIFSGSIAFILFFLFDYYKIKKFTVPKDIVGLCGFGMFLYSGVMTFIKSPKIYFPLVIQMSSTILFILALMLLVYSLFLELPFRTTYMSDSEENSLVDKGTYALCRHPGVLWLFLSLVFSFLATGAVLTAVAAIIWTGINIAYVYLQEKLFFQSMFQGYEQYRKSTPMLIPTKCSIKKCLNTLKLNGGNENEESR